VPRPVRAVVLLLVAVVLAGCSRSSASTFSGAQLHRPYHVPDTTLADTSGRPYALTSTGKRLTLIFFGYTHCPDECPTTMATLASAMTQLDDADRANVQVVFVTTDPAYDTPDVLAEYLGRFDADLPVRFVGLTGSQDLIDQAQLSAGVPLAEDDGRLHSSLLLLYGTDDAAHVAFDAGNTSRDIAADLEAVAGAA
jgi:protein SCO1